MKPFLSALGLIFLLLVIFQDARFHFDPRVLDGKIKHRSAQKHWHLFYTQSYVYNSSSFRYAKDFEELKKHIKPGYVLLSDVATSYYASALLPVYVKNIHIHHGRNRDKLWSDILNSRAFCSPGHSNSRMLIENFLHTESGRNKNLYHANLRYLLLNTDKRNWNMQFDCLSISAHSISASLNQIAKPLYQGEYLQLFEFIQPNLNGGVAQ